MELNAVEQLLRILSGVPITLSISVLSFLIGLAIGLPLAFTRTYNKRLRYFVDIFEKVFRGIPELVLMLLFFFGIGLTILPVPFGNAFFTATFVLGLRSAANQSQIYRGAIRGIGDEQMIAGKSLGLSKMSSIIHVMLPQVFTYSTPGLGSEYALLIKDSAYAIILPGIYEIMNKADSIRTITSDIATPYVIAALVYILLTFPVATWLDAWGNKRKKKLGL